jgi:Cupin superfamily protein
VFFFREIWERKPLLIRRHDSNYNKGWFSTEELDHILREVSWLTIVETITALVRRLCDTSGVGHVSGRKVRNFV